MFPCNADEISTPRGDVINDYRSLSPRASCAPASLREDPFTRSAVIRFRVMKQRYIGKGRVYSSESRPFLL